MFYLKWIFSFVFYSFVSFSFALVNPESYPGVVQLIGQTGLGTGVFITPGTLFTANHVANDGPLYFKDDSTGDIVFTSVLYRDERNDVAVLKVVGTSMGYSYESEDFYSLGSLDETKSDFLQKAIKEHFHRQEIGELVTIPGFPHGSFNIVQGVITDHWDLERVINNVRIAMENVRIVTVTNQTDQSMHVFTGLSGAPAFSKDKQLIGVIVLGNTIFDPNKKIGFVSIEKLKDLIRREEGMMISPSEKKEIKEIKEIIFVMLNKHSKN